VSLRYRPDLPLALRDVSFTVHPGERAGIVGRTGAGKSSVAQALFRGVELEQGNIVVDGKDIAQMGLDTVSPHYRV
jgi:ABC-type multidrug transport system fused ATPase/permease subunit